MSRLRQDRALAALHETSEAARDVVTRRPPTPYLPLEFYDPEWLHGRTEEYVEKVLCISEEVYDWVVGVADLHCAGSTRRNVSHR